MSIDKIKNELRQMRNLNRRRVTNELTSKYRSLFAQLPPLEEKVMCECYINGKSYSSCGYKISYCEQYKNGISGVYIIYKRFVHL